MEAWRERLTSLDDSQQEMLLGSSLSQRFAAWPLIISQPAIVGAFYGCLVTIALILPIGYHNEWNLEAWFNEASFRGLSVALGLAIAGQFSAIVAKILPRPPIAPPRVMIYTMPFVGFAIILGNWMGIAVAIPEMLAWILMLASGPIYVHLSWAPRHRMLTMLEDGRDPFGPANFQIEQIEMEQELEDAVNALDE